MGKTKSVFFHKDLLNIIKKNAWNNAEARNSLTEKAAPWLHMSDDQLWNLVFSSSIKRAYHVLSDGYCPSCRCEVPLFNWIIDVWNRPYKVQCPGCKEFFPKNDFYAFYQSGIDKNGQFNYDIADRSLLINQEARSPDEIRFGVDDGNGYSRDGRTWMFIAYYMLFGHWTRLVIDGIKNLAKAYAATGYPVYARKACILLDRVADVYPDFDFMTQGIMYDRKNVDHGYVSYWFVSCLEVRDLAIAYDMIFDAVKNDRHLVSFLKQKSVESSYPVTKDSFEKIQENIETRIFRDALRNSHKIKSNVPQTDITRCMVETVLEWPNNKEKIMEQIASITHHTTAVDGTTGEKGLVVYGSHAVWGYSNFIWYYENMQPGFIEELLKIHPIIKDSYRFFIDTWCLQKYYPRIGDTGAFAQPDTEYAVLYYSKDYYKHSYLDPSIETVLWKMYEITHDPDFAKIIYISNGYTAKGAFRLDITRPNLCKAENALEEVIRCSGYYLEQKSVNKENWRLALLHSGEAEYKRAVWLHYDSGGYHGHHDGLTAGFYAKGLDLMPDFGYPPVHLGWDYGRNPKFAWYRSTAAHNTVSVDWNDHAAHAKFQSDMGKILMWSIGKTFKAISAACPEAIGENRFERTLLLSDISVEDCYLIDVFRIEGGSEHVKFMRTTFGKIIEHPFHLTEFDGSKWDRYGCLRNFKSDIPFEDHWYVTWEIDDSYYRMHEGDVPVYLKYTDLSGPSTVILCESWVDLWRGKKDSKETDRMEDWIPTLITKKTGSNGFRSVFASVIEPFEGRSNIHSVKRYAVSDAEGKNSENNIAIEILLENNLKDYIVISDQENGSGQNRQALFSVPFWKLETDARICIVRSKATIEGTSESLEPVCITIMDGSYVTMKNLKVKCFGRANLIEVHMSDGKLDCKIDSPDGNTEMPVEITY